MTESERGGKRLPRAPRRVSGSESIDRINRIGRGEKQGVIELWMTKSLGGSRGGGQNYG